MPPKKVSKGFALPRHDRSRSLPVRTGWGLWKTLVIATAVGVLVFVMNDAKSDTPSQPAQVVSPQ